MLQVNQMKQMPNVIFLPVKTNQHKIGCICYSIQTHFAKGEAILIIAPSEQAVQYLDDLLWKFPDDSFLPHVVSQSPCKEKVVITTLSQNLNSAKILMNLCPESCSIAEQFEIIYELYDETHPEKLEQSKRRHQTYSQKSFNIKDLKEKKDN